MPSALDFVHLIITLWTLGASPRLWLPEIWRYLAPLVRSWLSRFELRLLYRGRVVLALGDGRA